MRKNDFKQMLLSVKDRMDINTIRKYINENLKNKKMITKELEDINEILENRYKKYGIIDSGDNMIYLNTGNYNQLIKGLNTSLGYVQQKINSFKSSFSTDEFFWAEVERNWNNLSELIQLLLEIENYNMTIYKNELKAEYQRMRDNPKAYTNKHKFVTFQSKYSEKQLQKVYDYIRTKTNFWSEDNGGSRNFIQIFSNYSINGIKKIKLKKYYGRKAFVRSLIETLTGRFNAKIINLCFCDENGNSLGISSHDRASKKYNEVFDRLLN